MKRRMGGATLRCCGRAALIFLAAVLTGCLGDGPCGPESVECSTLPAPRKEKAPRLPTRSPITGARVYLDLTKTMRGYIADEQSRMSFTLFQHALDHVVEEAFQAADLPKVAHFGFGEKIMPDIGALQAFAVQAGEHSPKDRFDQGNTDFIRVLQDSASHPEALSVIITDGVQDLRTRVAGQVGPGFLRTELVRVVKTKLMDQGFGIWILGVMSAFDPQDCYYNVKPDHQGRVNECIPAVERRPVYIWVIARDVETGRKFSRYVYDEMRQEASKGGKGPEGLVHVLEVWPANLPHPSISIIEFRRIHDESLSMRNILSDVHSWTPASEGVGATSGCIGFSESAGGTVALPVEVN